MKTFWKILLGIALSLVVICSALITYAAVISRGAALDESKLINASSSVEIYDESGELVKEISLTTGGQSAKIENIPLKTREAFISVEDKRFYSHGGIDFKRVIAAILKNVKSFSFKEGASTITQQLMKNTHLSGEKTIERKLKEIKLSLAAEKKYSKDEILEMYLNTIYFGHGCFGIADAAGFYFGKSVDELDIAESATLSGLIKSPNNYSPLKNGNNCLLRRNFVLNAMYKQGYISEQELSSALKEELPQKSHGAEFSSYSAEAISEAENLIDKSAFYGGIKIYTYLDKTLQENVENLNGYIDSDKTYIIGDNSSLGINAFYSTVSADTKRLPGSIIKPVLVYAPAIEEGLISPATPINDEPISYGGYSPKNFGGKYQGYISARKALSESVNVPAVKILNSVGLKKACAYAEKAGLKIEENDRSLALALGGMSKGFSLKDLCSAYSTFARGGLYGSFSFIKKIETKNGDELYSRKTSLNRAFSEETSSVINDMLITAAKEGTAKKLKDFNFELCAKTGTCESGGKNTDAYTISYTSEKTVGVWIGDAANEAIETTGGGIPCAINGKICNILYKNSPPKAFKKSGNIVAKRLDVEEYRQNHNLILADDNAPKKETFEEIFIKKFAPMVKSERFSNPSFSEVPTIEYNKNSISIVLCQREYTTYCITRTDELGNKTYYEAEGSFKDNKIETNKIYTYTVTPKLNGLTGKPITLPSVSTKEAEEKTPLDDESDKSILDKDWWNE